MKGWGRPLLMTAVLMTVVGLGFSAIVAFLPLYARTRGATPAQIGWMVSSFAVASILSSAVGGRLADRCGRRAVLVGGTTVFALSTLLLARVSGPWPLVAFRFIEGLGYGMALPAGNALAQDLAPGARRGTALGTYATITLVGTLVGPAAAGGVVERFGYPVLLLSIAGVALLATVLLLMFVPETSRTGCGASVGPRAPALTVTRPLLAAYVVAGAVALNNGLSEVVEALFFRTRFGASAGRIGFVFSIVGAAALLARLLGGVLTDRWGARRLMPVGLLGSGLATASMAVLPGFVAAACATALGAFCGVLAFSAVPVVIADNVASPLRGRANGTLGMLSSLGLLVGAPLGAALYATAPGLPFWLAGAGFGVAAFVVLRTLRPAAPPPGDGPRKGGACTPGRERP